MVIPEVGIIRILSMILHLHVQYVYTYIHVYTHIVQYNTYTHIHVHRVYLSVLLFSQRRSTASSGITRFVLDYTAALLYIQTDMGETTEAEE